MYTEFGLSFTLFTGRLIFYFTRWLYWFFFFSIYQPFTPDVTLCITMMMMTTNDDDDNK